MTAAPAPARDEVHVHRFGLDVAEEELGLLVETLSWEERVGAERIRDLRLRRRTLAARGLLRATLARYLGVEPAAVALVRGAHGKPALVGAGTALRFSASRSANTGVLAVATGSEVGVDVERVEPKRAFGPIADRLFAEEEAAELRALHGDRRVHRFFELWTRKEAYAKALGVGLGVPLDRLRAPPGWFVRDLPVGAGFVCALCVRGGARRVSRFG